MPLDLEYLGPLTDRPGTVEVLSGLMGELFRANLHPAQVLPVARTQRERDVARLFAAWVDASQNNKIFDVFSAKYFAVRFTQVQSRAYMVHGFAHVDAAQAHWLDRMLGEKSLVTLPYVPDGLTRTSLSLSDLEQRGFVVTQLAEDAVRGIGPRAVKD